MNTFPDDLLDPGANWCPVCGEMRGICACDESDFMAEAADDWNENPCHQWEQIWDDGVGQRWCVCTVCGEDRIFEYEAENDV